MEPAEIRSKEVPQGEIPEYNLVCLSDLPNDLFKEIFAKLENSSNYSLVSMNWYKLFVEIQSKALDQIKIALGIIIQDIQTLENKNSLTVDLEILLTSITTLDNRKDLEVAYPKFKRDIIQILKKLSKEELTNILQSHQNLNHDTRENYPLFAKLLGAALCMNIIEGQNFDSSKIDFLTNFAKFSNDADLVIELGKKYRDLDDTFYLLFKGLLISDDIDNIKTAIRIKRQLKNQNIIHDGLIPDIWNYLAKSVETLFWSNNHKLIIKLAEAFDQKELEQIISHSLVRLMDGKKYDLAQEILVKIFNKYETYNFLGKTTKLKLQLEFNSFFNEVKNLMLLLEYCIVSLCAEGKIEAGLKILSDYKLKIPNFEVGTFYNDDIGKYISKMSQENQVQLLEQTQKYFPMDETQMNKLSERDLLRLILTALGRGASK